MKQPFTSRIEETDIKKAVRKGLDLPELFRGALAKTLQTSRCPTCGANLKHRRVVKKARRKVAKVVKKSKRRG